MKIRTFSCSLKNLKGRVNEDHCLISEKHPIFAVADGVSRTRNPDGSYPEPSGAALAAELFCQEVIATIKDGFGRADLKVLREAFFNANFAIRLLNVQQGISQKLDYLVNDYFGTCGAAAFIKGEVLHYGYLGDCGLRVYNQNDLLKFICLDDVALLEEYRDSLTFASKDDKMRFWRETLRNKPHADYLTYGIFTGEPEVKRYYHFGKLKINSGDTIFLYSDGCLRFIKMPAFRQLFRTFQGEELERGIRKFVQEEIAKHSGEETSDAFGDDKTLIAGLV